MPIQDFSVGLHLMCMIKRMKKVHCQFHQILGEAKIHKRKSLHHTKASLYRHYSFNMEKLQLIDHI